MTLVRKDKTGGFLEVRHYKDLLIQLVTRDLKLKYRRSVLGYVWSVLNPLLIMIVMYVVFSKLFDRNIPNFPVYLLVGRTLYDFVVKALYIYLVSRKKTCIWARKNPSPHENI